MSPRAYDVHGVSLVVDAPEDAVGSAIDDRLRHFRAAAAGAPDVRHEVRVVRGAGDHELRRPDGPGRQVYDPPTGEVRYFAETDALWIDVDGQVQVHATPGLTRVSVTRSAAANVWLLSRPMFTIPFVEQLKRRGLFSIHAAAAALDGRAVVLPGASGSGKSTLAVALARAGWDLMADDMVFVDRELRLLAFPDEADVSAHSARWFPELGDLDASPAPGWPKHRLRLEHVLGGTVSMSARPAALAFPSPGPSDDSALEVLEPGSALLELAPNVLLTEPGSSQAHLDAIASLVSAAPAHRLLTGRDFDALAQRLSALLR